MKNPAITSFGIGALCFLWWLFLGGNNCVEIISPNGRSAVKVVEYDNIIVGGHIVFTSEEDISYYSLPETYLLGANKWRLGWRCMLHWSGDLLEIYTPNENQFKAHHLNSSSILWSEMDDDAFNELFYDELDTFFIRYASNCSSYQVNINCL